MMEKRKKQYFIFLAAIVLCALIFAAYTLPSRAAPELTKEEALTLMNLQAKAVMATMDRNEYADQLFRKYGLSPRLYDLDIATGRFVSKETTTSHGGSKNEREEE